MAKKKTGKQLDLIDVKPKQSKKILAVANDYKEAVSERQGWLAQEVKLKTELLDLIKKENLTPLKDGVIRFDIDGTVISVTPRDELVKVKLPKTDED